MAFRALCAGPSSHGISPLQFRLLFLQDLSNFQLMDSGSRVWGLVSGV